MNPCVICGKEDTVTYGIKRGNVARQVSLCSEHGAFLEELILRTTQRRKEPSRLVQLDELKPSKATEARKRRAKES